MVRYSEIIMCDQLCTVEAKIIVLKILQKHTNIKEIGNLQYEISTINFDLNQPSVGVVNFAGSDF